MGPSTLARPVARSSLLRAAGRCVAGLALSGAIVAFGSAAAAETRAPTVIVVAPVDAASLPRERLVDALRSQLAELGVELVVSAAPAQGPIPGGDAALAEDRDVLAFVWIEASPDALVVHFYEPAGATLRERRIPVTGTGAASIEEIAVVVRSAASALIERARRPPEPPVEAPPEAPAAAPPAPAPSPPPAAGTGRSSWGSLSLAYVGALFAAEVPLQHGLHATLGLRLGGSRWWMGAGYAWFPVLRRETEAVSLELRRHPAELSLAYELPLVAGRAVLLPEGAVIADLLQRETTAVAAGLAATPTSRRWAWATSLRLRLAWEPAPPLRLHVAGGADFLLNRFDAAVDERSVLRPLPVSPRLELGVAAVLR